MSAEKLCDFYLAKIIKGTVSFIFAFLFIIILVSKGKYNLIS